MGGDPARCDVVQAVRVNGRDDGLAERSFSLQTDLAHLERTITQKGTVLVIVDPVSNYMGAADTYRESDVRQVLTPLAQLAERTGVAVLLVVHLTKDTKASALYRLNSSIAFGGVARLVLAAGTAPEEPNPYASGVTRILASIKQNICEPATPWAYRTVENRVEWLGPRDDIRPDVLFAGPSRSEVPDARADVEAFLCSLLATGAPMPSSEIEAAAAAEGITRDRLYKTRKQVCDSKRIGFGEHGRWEWRLKPEFVTPPPLLAASLPPLGPIPCTPPEVANNGAVAPITPELSTPSPLIGTSAIYERSANNGGADVWEEI